jgi:hypothetical protein
MRPATLVLGEKVAHSLEFGQERFSNCETRVLGVVNSGITQLGFGVWVYPIVHASRALTRASASSPGTMEDSPDRTSSRRR